MNEDISARGKAADPKPMFGDCIRMAGCPDCDGRGWFLIRPFETGGANGCGGAGNTTQCLTCKNSHAYWQEHQALPPDVQARIDANKKKEKKK